MEYSKDIIIGIDYPNIQKGGKTKHKSKIKIIKYIKKHKLITTISAFCGILMILDYMLIYNFIELLQRLI